MIYIIRHGQTATSGGSYWSKYIGNCAVYVTAVTDEGNYEIPVEVNMQ